MATQSKGYPGRLNTVDFAKATPRHGAIATVVGPESWKVVADATAGDRALRIVKGVGQGYGVRDEVDVDVILSGADVPQVSVGTSRWDTVVCRRDWRPGVVGDRTTFVNVTGGVQKALAPGLFPPSNAGVIADQPLAAVQYVAGSTTPAQVLDLRTFKGDGGFLARDELARSFYNDTGSRIVIAEPGQVPREWLSTLDADGFPEWLDLGLFGSLPVWSRPAGTSSTGSTLDGPPPTSQQPILLSFGSAVVTTDLSGYARITFPKPFPNGLLWGGVLNGDGSIDRSVGLGLHFSLAGLPWHTGRKNELLFSVTGYNAAPAKQVRVRANWFAIGH